MFGGIFDFNRDGKTDTFEMALGLSIAFNEDDGVSDTDDYSDEEDGGLLSDACSDDLEDELDALEEQLSELQDKLSDLEDNEPDDCTTAAYDRWERRKDLLEEQISELEDQISEIEDQMEEY